MEINYHLLTIFEYNQTRINKQQKQFPHNNRPKRLLLQASSYLSIGHMIYSQSAHTTLASSTLIDRILCLFWSPCWFLNFPLLCIWFILSCWLRWIGNIIAMLAYKTLACSNIPCPHALIIIIILLFSPDKGANICL